MSQCTRRQLQSVFLRTETAGRAATVREPSRLALLGAEYPFPLMYTNRIGDPGKNMRPYRNLLVFSILMMALLGSLARAETIGYSGHVVFYTLGSTGLFSITAAGAQGVAG